MSPRLVLRGNHSLETGPEGRRQVALPEAAQSRQEEEAGDGAGTGQPWVPGTGGPATPGLICAVGTTAQTPETSQRLGQEAVCVHGGRRISSRPRGHPRGRGHETLEGERSAFGWPRSPHPSSWAVVGPWVSSGGGRPVRLQLKGALESKARTRGSAHRPPKQEN